MTDESRNPDEVRRDIEHTREELADTAAALAQKADVKARAKERVDEVKADVREKTEAIKEKVSSNGTSAPGEESGFAASAQQAAGTAREQVRQNPVPAAAIAAALLGFALGYLVAHR